MDQLPLDSHCAMRSHIAVSAVLRPEVEVEVDFDVAAADGLVLAVAVELGVVVAVAGAAAFVPTVTSSEVGWVVIDETTVRALSSPFR